MYVLRKTCFVENIHISDPDIKHRAHRQLFIRKEDKMEPWIFLIGEGKHAPDLLSTSACQSGQKSCFTFLQRWQ